MLKRQLTSLIEAGTDEAGRGCLAGPVTAAAVIFPKNISIPKINDSKKLTENQRNQLCKEIESKSIAFSVQHVMQNEIDKLNILNASIKAMHKALEKLSLYPEFIAVDGNKFKNFKKIPHKCIIKGDSKFQHIAAASILAKTYRDKYMKLIHQKFEKYYWDNNKGYPTKKHREAIKKYGVTIHHRKSFNLFSKQTELNLF
ncbi:MAG: ribonuclease HII [Flavobacteriaceae bacterium]|nr:ribonuclease HII [Flavobacteriaceae bacterium]